MRLGCVVSCSGVRRKRRGIEAEERGRCEHAEYRYLLRRMTSSSPTLGVHPNFPRTSLMPQREDRVCADTAIEFYVPKPLVRNALTDGLVQAGGFHLFRIQGY